jgi:hypothetical protein
MLRPYFVLFALRPKAYGRRVVSFVVNDEFGFTTTIRMPHRMRERGLVTWRIK